MKLWVNLPKKKINKTNNNTSSINVEENETQTNTKEFMKEAEEVAEMVVCYCSIKSFYINNF